MKERQNEQVRFSISLEKRFYDLLAENARQDYLKVATWTKRFLMQNLENYNETNKCLTKNGTNM